MYVQACYKFSVEVNESCMGAAILRLKIRGAGRREGGRGGR